MRASLYIGDVWIRQPRELSVKRLLGLLLVMAMVECGVAELEKLAAKIERNEQGEITGVNFMLEITGPGLARLAHCYTRVVHAVR